MKVMSLLLDFNKCLKDTC